MITITIGNRKGGVGKTSTTHALGELLANKKRRVLLVDMDPQGSLTESAGIVEPEKTLADVLGGSSAGKESIFTVAVELSESLYIAPGGKSLIRSELGLIERLGRELVLKKALVDSGFDLVLIDTPPGLSILSVNALAAADGLLIPVVPQTPDLRGLKQFLENVDQIREAINPQLETIGIVPTFYEDRLIHHRSAIEALSAAELPILDTRIGRSVRISEAANSYQSIVSYDPKNKQALSYQALAKEVEVWLTKRVKM